MHNLHRVIEFRGLTSDFVPGEQRWAYGDLDCSDVYTGINEGHSASTPVLDETVGQYVGIQDVNGKRLYEGDVVKMDWGTGNDTGVLYFDTTRCAFRLRNAWCGCNIQRDPTDGIQYTLIGNIFEHAKLKDEYARFYWGLTK